MARAVIKKGEEAGHVRRKLSKKDLIADVKKLSAAQINLIKADNPHAHNKSTTVVRASLVDSIRRFYEDLRGVHGAMSKLSGT